MNLFKSTIALGTQNLPFIIANKVRMTNIVAVFSVIVSALYTLNYIFILIEPTVAFINLVFTLAYALTLLFNKYHAFKKSKIWFFCLLMLHLVVCTNIFVTNETGFHLYFFLVPTGAFLLFDLNEKFEKLSLSFLAIILFIYCENTLNLTPLIHLSDEMNHLIYQSVFFINMLEVIFVLTLFANELDKNHQKLNRQATTDSLTGINNRHHFFEQTTYDLAIANEYNRPFSIILLDFDNFKKINDRYGHHIGDLSLVETTKQIKTHCRTQDCFARIGGDEFIIALADTTLNEAKEIAERIKFSVENNIFSVSNNINLSCKISLGIASTRASDNQELKELMQSADKALYQAKTQGGNKVGLSVCH